ncbi:MAG: DUF2064 domain-containing protein [Ignavibacteriae bacterium]|nr:MAG: DUF2064 domain-containing protein [Ignavibacteriota bacterium]
MQNKITNNNALIVFAVNPVVNIENVRPVERDQDKEALKVYLNSLRNVYRQTKNLDSKKFLFLDIGFNQKKYDSGYQICIQYGNDAGMKMYHAFEKIFDYGHNKAVILAADMPGIKKETVETAFEKLDNYDFVIGPTSERGFYLLGTKELSYEIFGNMLLNERPILDNLVDKIQLVGKSYFLLEELSNAGNAEILNSGIASQKQLKIKRN